MKNQMQTVSLASSMKSLNRYLVKTSIQFDGVPMKDSGLTRFKNSTNMNIIRIRETGFTAGANRRLKE
jgi:hypothetical protein